MSKIKYFERLKEIEERLDKLSEELGTTKDETKRLDLKTRINILEDLKDFNLALYFDCGKMQ